MQSVFDASARASWASLHATAWAKRLQLDERQTRKVVAAQETLERQSRPTQKAVNARVGAERARLRSRRSNTNKVAASDIVMAGIVDELSAIANGSLVEDAHFILTSVKNAAEALSGLINSAELRSGIANSHLWCELLARAVEKVESSIQEPFSIALNEYLTSQEGRTMEKVIGENLMNRLTPVLDSKATESSHSDLSSSVRVAATFICPAPESHQLVTDECFIPLARTLLNGQDFALPMAALDLH